MKLDMHIHSWYSYHPRVGRDCYTKPRGIVKAAVKAGLDGISVTDHNSLKGGLVTARTAKRIKGDFIVVPGMEIKSTNGDILAYGVGEEIPLGLSPGETIERILDQGGIPVIAHPFCSIFLRLSSMEKWRERQTMLLLLKLKKKIGFKLDRGRWNESQITGLSRRFGKKMGIEVFNANSPPKGNENALALAKRLGLPISAGSDSHVLKSIGNAGIICDSDPLESLRRGRVKTFGSYNPLTIPIRVYWTKFWNLLRNY